MYISNAGRPFILPMFVYAVCLLEFLPVRCSLFRWAAFWLMGCGVCGALLSSTLSRH